MLLLLLFLLVWHLLDNKLIIVLISVLSIGPVGSVLLEDHRSGVHASAISVLVLLWGRLIALKRIWGATFFGWFIGCLIYRGPNLVLYRFFSNFAVIRGLEAETLLFWVRFSFQGLTFPAIFWRSSTKFGLFCEILLISTTTLGLLWLFVRNDLNYGTMRGLLLLFGSCLFGFNLEINKIVSIVELSRKLILVLRWGWCIGRSSLGLQIAELFGRISCRSCYRWGDLLSRLIDRSCEFNGASRFSSWHLWGVILSGVRSLSRWFAYSWLTTAKISKVEFNSLLAFSAFSFRGHLSSRG